MKITEQTMAPEVLQELQKLIIERLTNVNRLRKVNAEPLHGLMADLCVVECKMDAILLMLEAQGADFSKFQDHLFQAAKQARATAINLRSHMT